MSRAFAIETIELDLPALAGGLTRRLRDAGIAVEPDRAARLAHALALTRPVARRRLYWTARAVLVSDRSQVPVFDAVFASVFGTDVRALVEKDALQVARALDETPTGGPEHQGAPSPDHDPWSIGSAPARDRGRDSERAPEREVPVATIASADEVLRTKRFDALEPDELAQLYALMSRLSLSAPRRRTRRYERGRRGGRVDLRRTLRASLRTGGEPVRLTHRRRRVQRRRIVMLCDISGSMEPYARAYLQFLTCAAGGSGPGARNEAFAFATRLTRLTRALHSRHPERAIAQAAATAPDWSSGTRIGDALAQFNDRHGRRGMARGAVIVILSDGWERDDPTVVGREMERLARLAHRIVWVNPRVSARGFSPQTGGMAAALPHCDALLGGDTLQALEEVAEAIAAAREPDGHDGGGWDVPTAADETDDADEPWPSAGWVGSYSGSSVAMPSGYGPSRGRTTPGWSLS